MTDWEQISASDWEQLSAYVDGELPPHQAAGLEARLEQDPSLQQALLELRGTVETVRRLPAADPPRNFVLTEQMAGRTGSGLLAAIRDGLGGLRLYPTLQLGTALAALALVTLIGFDVVVNNSLAGVSLDGQQAPEAGMVADRVMADDLTLTEQPMMLAEEQQAPLPADAARAAEYEAGQAAAGAELEQELAEPEEEQVEAAAEVAAQTETEPADRDQAPEATGEQEQLATEQPPAAEQEFAAAPAEQPEAEIIAGTEPAADELRAAEPLGAEQPAESEQAPGLEPAGRAALTAAEIGLAAATLLLLVFTLRERRRA